MIYIVYRTGSARYVSFDVVEFTSTDKALNWLGNKPRTGIVGVFDGKRLDLKIGERKVVKKTVVGFSDFKSEELEEGKE